MTPGQIVAELFDGWQPLRYPPVWKLWWTACRLLAFEKRWRKRHFPREAKFLRELVVELHRAFHDSGHFDSE